MTQSLQMRAASLGASALLIGAALVAAVSVRYALPAQDLIPDAQIFDALRPPEPPPVIVPPRASTPQPPLQAPTQYQGALDLPPPLNVDISTGPSVSMGPTLAAVTNPDWVRRPSDLDRYYPSRARRLGAEGVVVLDCRVSVSGDLGCAVISETPPEWGFGQAALRIAGEHRMRPAMRGGVPVEGRYVMRVPFTLE
jgi:TonB family protein